MADEKASTDTRENNEEATIEEFIEVNRQRKTTYSLLSRLFRSEIDEALYDELRAMRFPADAGNENATKGYHLIATYLSNVWENTMTDLSVDYSAVFIGNGVDAYSAAYPYESVYTSPKRLLMQGARDEVLAIYRSEGFDKLDTWREGEDHIALELEFQERMCDKVIDALQEGNQEAAAAFLRTQRNFFRAHLATWVPLLISDMKRFAKTDFYMGLAYLTEGFLEIEQDFLDDVISDDEDDEGAEDA